MKNPRNIKKTSAGNPGRVNQILKQTARAVGYLVASLVLAGVVSSCAASVKTHTLDCTPKPLPKECEHAL